VGAAADGDVLVKLGHPEQASERHQAALRLMEHLNHPDESALRRLLSQRRP